MHFGPVQGKLRRATAHEPVPYAGGGIAETAAPFDVRGKILVQSSYAQGTWFLDVSDPTNPRQIAYFRPGDASAWAPYWHGRYVYVADNVRGVDILRLTA